jgi:hypothetical protein
MLILGGRGFGGGGCELVRLEHKMAETQPASNPIHEGFLLVEKVASQVAENGPTKLPIESRA